MVVLQYRLSLCTTCLVQYLRHCGSDRCRWWSMTCQCVNALQLPKVTLVRQLRSSPAPWTAPRNRIKRPLIKHTRGSIPCRSCVCKDILASSELQDSTNETEIRTKCRPSRTSAETLASFLYHQSIGDLRKCLRKHEF